MPSASARSIAAIMMSAVVEPAQPNTRYAPKVTFGATPLTTPFAPMMPATWVPWPAQSSGFASGVATGLYAGDAGSALKALPTKSQPAMTRAVGNDVRAVGAAAAEIRMVDSRRRCPSPPP